MSKINDVEIKKMTKEQNYLRGYSDGKADAIEELKSKADCDICYECAMADENLDCMLGLKEQTNGK